MSRQAALAIALVTLLSLAAAACTILGTNTATPGRPTWTPTRSAESQTVIPGAGVGATATATPVGAAVPGAPSMPPLPTNAPPPQLSGAPPGTPLPAAPATPPPANTTPAPAGFPPYQDDRSGPLRLLQSYVNALNRREYLRAYSYWEVQDGSAQPGPYQQFRQGYADTASVELVLGEARVGAAAGSIFYGLPVGLLARSAGGAGQTFSGCFTLHLGQPGNQAAPPFRGLAIQSASVRQVADNTPLADLVAPSVCADMPAGPAEPLIPTAAAGEIDAARYIDDRSDPIQVLRSLFNAVNRREYTRAYSYWETPPQSFDQFAAGYADTRSVTLVAGPASGEVNAGQASYRVPVVLTAVEAHAASSTFYGCYQIHLTHPAAQETLPFRPMAIRSGVLREAANDADRAGLLAQACR